MLLNWLKRSVNFGDGFERSEQVPFVSIYFLLVLLNVSLEMTCKNLLSFKDGNGLLHGYRQSRAQSRIIWTLNKFLGSIVEVTFYLNPVHNKATLGFFDISINIKFENLARKLSFFSNCFYYSWIWDKYFFFNYWRFFYR